MAKTRVDLEQLLEDLPDASPYSLSDSILTEIMANSLGSEEEKQLSDSIARVKQKHRSVPPCNGAATLHRAKTPNLFSSRETTQLSCALQPTVTRTIAPPIESQSALLEFSTGRYCEYLTIYT